MNRSIVLVIICLALMTIAAAAYAEAEAAAGAFSTNLDVAYVSKYVWRGTIPNPDPCLQPSLTFAHKSGASLNVWGSADLTDVYDQRDHLSEIDYTLDYATQIGGRSVNGGLIHYTFPHTDFSSTSEVYAALCFDGKITTSLAANYDFDEADGLYTSVTAGYACTAPWQKETAPELNISAKVGYATGKYNAFYFGTDKAAFTDLLLSASVPVQVGGKLSLTPSISYSRVLDSELRDAVADPDCFYVGVTASMPL